MMFSKSKAVIGLVALMVVLGGTGCSDSANTAKIEVSAWGNQRTVVGQGFNIQPDGGSALWFKSTWPGKVDNLEIWFGDQKLGGVSLTSGQGMSAIIPPSLLTTPRKVPVHLVNKLTGDKVDVGVFEIFPAQ